MATAGDTARMWWEPLPQLPANNIKSWSAGKETTAMAAAGAAEPGLPTQTTFLCWWLAAGAAGDMETTTCHQASMEETVAGAVARAQQGLAALPEPAEAMERAALELPAPKTEPGAAAAAGLKPVAEQPTVATIPKVRAEQHL